MISRESLIRQRTKPRIWDFAYVMTMSHVRTVRRLAGMIGDDSRILDVGCGHKPFRQLLPHREYIGIDFDDDSSEADLRVDCSTERIPFEDGSFDVVIVSETLEHLLNVDHALSEIERVVKKGGYVFVSTPFLFREHAAPHDYYRFTRHFYREKFRGYAAVEMKTSSTFLSSPLVLANQVLEDLPLPVVKRPLIALGNILILLLDRVKTIAGALAADSGRAADLFDSCYGGISLLLRK